MYSFIANLINLYEKHLAKGKSRITGEEWNILIDTINGTVFENNALLNFFQEYKAEKEVENLKKLTTPITTIRRENKILEVPSSNLVKGDIIYIKTGDIISADIRLIECSNLKVDESSLTGESISVKKNNSTDEQKKKYDELLAIKDANVATTIDKSGLNTAIANANTLIAAIEAKGDGYYESVAGFGLAELSFALQNAETVVDRFYLTEEQYNETLTQLNNCYTTTNGIVALDCSSENRNNLKTLIF